LNDERNWRKRGVYGYEREEKRETSDKMAKIETLIFQLRRVYQTKLCLLSIEKPDPKGPLNLKRCTRESG
jgi:hypothetical protein